LQFDRILEQNSVYKRYQISYLSEGLRISWIMNIPNWNWPYPLVILNHGYIDPAVYTNGRGLKREQDYLARKWFAVLHTDYRNHAFSDTDTELELSPYLRTKKYWTDAINAVLAVQNVKKEWVKELVAVDTEKVGMLGHSMWWWVTMYSLVAQSWLVDAAVLYAPVHSHEFYNFNRWLKNRLDDAWYMFLQNILWPLDRKETFDSFSPETYFERITAPIQIYFGTNDESCPVERWREIRAVLQNNNKSVELIEYVWEKHEFTRQWESFMQWVVVFLWEQL
jgi:dipeptidyl aminopeptidase/acylaminoacyl peptidase